MMVIYLSKTKKFIECVEIHANTVDRGHSQIDYLDIIATLTDGRTISLVNKREPYHPIPDRFYIGSEDEEEKETIKEIWEKVKKAMLAGKAVTLPM